MSLSAGSDTAASMGHFVRILAWIGVLGASSVLSSITIKYSAYFYDILDIVR
jgi:hypothetical protein